MKVAIAGAGGKMGRALIEAVQADGSLTLGAALDAPESPALGTQIGNVTVGSDIRAAVAAADLLIGNGGNDTFQYFSDAQWNSIFEAFNDITGEREPLSGKNGSYDRFEGGQGFDTLLGSPGESGSMYITSFNVGLGKDDSTPTGTWQVEPHKKIKNPTYFSPRGEGVIEA